jgi:NAD(P)-dependent dehydrogenase (short-subunit alcohol dehydrogenase family)
MNPHFATLLIGFSCLFCSVYPADRLDASEASAQKAVLVTGASSGIGRNIAERLAFEMGTVGFKVSVIEPGPYKSNAIASNCRRRKA